MFLSPQCGAVCSLLPALESKVWTYVAGWGLTGLWSDEISVHLGNDLTNVNKSHKLVDGLLNQGIFTKKFYSLQEDGQWRFKTPDEFEGDAGLEPPTSQGALTGFSLDDAILSRIPITLEFRDRLTFLSLCELHLDLDYRKRITPGAALYHPFITMKYLEEDQSGYADWARDTMAMVINNNPTVPQEPPTKEEPKETSQNQSNLLHSSREYECSENAERPLPKYQLLQLLGEGMFGQVHQCFKPHTSEIVALKVLKYNNQEAFNREMCMMHHVRQLDPDKYNIVRFMDSGLQNCLALEMLDVSLKDRIFKLDITLELSDVRPIAQQLLVAFEGLRELGVVHMDLTLDNVMLVSQKQYPFKVKLIDFGAAHLKSELKVGMQMQPNAFQAPELSLGLPLTEAVDMWSLGCILVQMYLGDQLFSDTPYENQTSIIHALGFPPSVLLNQGIFTTKFYTQEEDGQWRIKSPEEIQKETGLMPLNSLGPLQGYSLAETILSNPPTTQTPEYRDRRTFVSLCERLLDLDYRKRITPGAALDHPFITMDSFKEDQSDYGNWARGIMAWVIHNNNNPRGPQEPPIKEEDLKETTKNQCDSLHSPSEYWCVENEENLLEKSQQGEEEFAHVSFKFPLPRAVCAQPREEEPPGDTGDGKINHSIEAHMSTTTNAPFPI